MKVLNRKEESPSEDVTPSYLFTALRSQGFVVTGDEQDAHELVQGLLDVIESNQTAVLSPTEPLSLTDFSEPSMEALNRSGHRIRAPSVSKNYYRVYYF